MTHGEATWTAEGRVRIAILSSYSAISGSIDYPEKLKTIFRAGKETGGVSAISPVWRLRSLEREVEATYGRAVFIESDLADAMFAVCLRDDTTEAKQHRQNVLRPMRDAIRSPDSDPAFSERLDLEGIDVIVFENGQISFAAYFTLDRGWDDDAVLQVFSHERINKVTEPYADYVGNLYDDIVDLIHGRILESESLTEKCGRAFRTFRKTINREIVEAEFPTGNNIRIRSLHLLYGGRTQSSDCSVLPDKYRGLLYARTRDPICSQSPHADKFVFLGYAFSYIFSKERDDDFYKFVLVTRILQSLFTGLEAIGSEIDRMLFDTKRERLRDVRKLQVRMKKKYHNLIAPTFVYRHELLVVRDALLQEWFVKRTLDKADYLLDALYAEEQRKQDKSERRFHRWLSLFLFVIAIISLVSVVTDLKSAGWLHWPVEWADHLLEFLGIANGNG